MMDSKLVLCLFFLFTQAGRASSFMCYVCSTKVAGQEDCLTVTEGTQKYLRDCYPPHNVTCRIVEQLIEFDIFDPRDKHVIRQCGSSPHDPLVPCYHRTGYGGRMSVCNCEGHGCNAAPPSGAPLYALVPLVLLLLNALKGH